MTEDELEEYVADRFQVDALGFCGCGDPVSNLRYVLGGLRLLDDLRRKVWAKEETYADWWARCQAHFGNERATYFFWYWLDKEHLSEHGGAVPGWLTESGERLLNELDAALKEPQ